MTYEDMFEDMDKDTLIKDIDAFHKKFGFEKNDKVGGLARTIKYKDSSYDIGPHRFYTLNKEVNSFYNAFLGNDGLDVKTVSKPFNLVFEPVNNANTKLAI